MKIIHVFFLVEPYQYTQIFKFSMTCFKPSQIDPIPVMARVVPGLFILSEDSFIRSMPDGTPEWHGTYSRWFFQRSYHGAEICRYIFSDEGSKFVERKYSTET